MHPSSFFASPRVFRAASLHLLALAAVFTAACSSKTSSPAAPAATATPMLTLTSSGTLSFDAPGATATLTWQLANAPETQSTTVTSDASWLGITCLSYDTVVSGGCAAVGTGNFNRAVSVSANAGSTPRTATVTLTAANGNSVTVSVAQAGVPDPEKPRMFLTSSSTASISNAAQTLTIAWSLGNAASQHRTLLRATSSGSWMAPDCRQTGDEDTTYANPYRECWYGPGGNGSYSRTVQVSANNTTSERTGTLKLFDEFNNNYTIAVTQAPGTAPAPTAAIALTSSSSISASVAAQSMTVTWTLTNAASNHRTLLRAFSGSDSGKWITIDCSEPGDENTTAGHNDYNECWMAPAGNGSHSRTIRLLSNGDYNSTRTARLELFDAFNNKITIPVAQAKSSPVISLLTPSEVTFPGSTREVVITFKQDGADAGHRMAITTKSIGTPQYMTSIFAIVVCDQPGDQLFGQDYSTSLCHTGPNGDAVYNRTVRFNSTLTSGSRTATLSVRDSFDTRITITITQSATATTIMSTPNVAAPGHSELPVDKFLSWFRLSKN